MKVKSHGKTQKIRRSTEQWQAIILAYEQSGLTQDAFCTRESLAPSSFYKWRQRLGYIKTAKPEVPLFVELASPQIESQQIHWDIELSLSDNIVLRLRQSN
jgi:transposase-like protein